jgi:hypothetical protein
MKKIVLVFGLISGAIMSALMFATLPFLKNGQLDLDRGEIIGYSSMVLSFLLVFFGVRSYRENVGHGQVGFWRALGVGLLIVLVSSSLYVISWEIIYFKFMPDFGDVYAQKTIEKMREKGESAAAIEATKKQMAEFKELYRNPVINVLLTFMEPLPVGLVMALVSAGILRRSKGRDPGTAALATS